MKTERHSTLSFFPSPWNYSHWDYNNISGCCMIWSPYGKLEIRLSVNKMNLTKGTCKVIIRLSGKRTLDFSERGWLHSAAARQREHQGLRSPASLHLPKIISISGSLEFWINALLDLVRMCVPLSSWFCNMYHRGTLRIISREVIFYQNDKKREIVLKT